jgi:membrane protein DedA with SNARE-associated domain
VSDLILAWVPEYGLPVLFVALSLAAIGVPFPGTLLLVAVGSLVSQGELPLWPVMATAASAAVLGDQVGYAVGRWGGARLLGGIERHDHGRLAQARALADRWGAVGIFLSRWLIGPLGPWVNLSSGLAAYSWGRFLLWDVVGEALWVGLYVTAGKVFSDQVAVIADLSSNLAWALVGVLLAAFFAWRLRHALHHAEA